MSTQVWEDPVLAGQRDQLIATLQSYGARIAVAYSGGIDSTVVAQAAFLARGEDAIAVTAVSDSLAGGEIEEAEALAKLIGIRHRVIRTEEFANPNYTRNHADRCYFCKSELYTRLGEIRDALQVDVVVSGANQDDAGDHRPGLVAASEHDVRHPLLECGLTKANVRALASAWNLPTWDKPATPCLSSRIAYGEEVTPERVRMIDQAEQWLRSHAGLRVLRVRYHKGDLARIEIPWDELSRFVSRELRSQLVNHFRSLGFKYITLDLEGFRSGSMNAVISIDQLSIAQPVPTSKR